MTELRQKCMEVLEPLKEGYTRICIDQKLDTSKKLYDTLLSSFLEEIPEITNRKFTLSNKRVREIITHVEKLNPKADKSAVELALHRVIQACKKSMPDEFDGKVLVRRRLRSEEIAVHDKSAFMLLDDFIEFRTWLCKSIYSYQETMPRNKQNLPEFIIASLIAVNGICLTNAHLHLSSSKKSCMKNEHDYATMDVPKSNYKAKNPPNVRYPVLPEIDALIDYMKGGGTWLFPSPFNPDSRYKKDTRTKKMNQWLERAWVLVFGKDSRVPKEWNIRTFIFCSRLYFILESSPIVTGFLSGRTTFASFENAPIGQVDDDKENVENKSAACFENTAATETGSLLMVELIGAIRSVLNSVNHRSQLMKDRDKVKYHLQGIAAFHADLLHGYPSLRDLVSWLVSELERRDDSRRFGVFQSYWQFLPMMFLDEMGSISPVNVDDNQWLRLAEYFIQENSYAAGTRSKVKQHLKAFHEYLCKTYPEHINAINWRRSELQVYLDQGGGVIPTISEFETLFNEASKEKPEWRVKMQATLTLAFFGGLRAEEICLISKMDIEEQAAQIRVWWSKTRQGRRRVPLFLLVPKKYLEPVIALQGNCSKKETLLFRNESGDMITADALGKRIKKLIKSALPEDRDMSTHTLRHGFGSWLLVRYFALFEPEILNIDDVDGSRSIIPDSDSLIFSPMEQMKLVRLFNGRLAGEIYAKDPSSFLSKPEHFAYMSRLIGHATRDTTSRTYVHSMEWIAFYYIRKLFKAGNCTILAK